MSIVSKGKMMGSIGISQAPLSDYEKVPAGYLLDYIAEVHSPNVRAALTLFLDGLFLFGATEEKGNLGIYTTMSLDLRSKLFLLAGDDYMILLERILPYIDRSFESAFANIEEWLDQKYESVEPTPEIVKSLTKELTKHNLNLIKGNFKHFNHYLVALLIANQGKVFKDILIDQDNSMNSIH